MIVGTEVSHVFHDTPVPGCSRHGVESDVLLPHSYTNIGRGGQLSVTHLNSAIVKIDAVWAFARDLDDVPAILKAPQPKGVPAFGPGLFIAAICDKPWLTRAGQSPQPGTVLTCFHHSPIEPSNVQFQRNSTDVCEIVKCCLSQEISPLFIQLSGCSDITGIVKRDVAELFRTEKFRDIIAGHAFGFGALYPEGAAKKM